MEGETNDKVYSIKNIHVHEHYNEVTYENDIALIQIRYVCCGYAFFHLQKRVKKGIKAVFLWGFLPIHV